MINKKFVFKENAIILENFSEFNPFINQNINLLNEHSKFINKENHLALFQKIVDMSIHDILTADFSDVEAKAPYYKIDREGIVYSYNVILILGTIYRKIFDRPGIRLSDVEEGINGPINTSKMFSDAYNELIFKASQGNGNSKAYGSTLIFATLFEHDLKTHVKTIKVKEYLNNLKNTVESGKVVLDVDDLSLFNFLYNYYYDVKIIHGYDLVRVTTEDMYNLFVKYSIVKGDNGEIKNLINNNFMLNGFLNSVIFSSIADERFVKISKVIFGKNKMNLRNNLAHCNFGYLDYYHMNATVILYILYLMICKGFYLKV